VLDLLGEVITTKSSFYMISIAQAYSGRKENCIGYVTPSLKIT